MAIFGFDNVNRNAEALIQQTLTASYDELLKLSGIKQDVGNSVRKGQFSVTSSQVRDFNGYDVDVVEITNGLEKTPIFILYDGKKGNDGFRTDVESIHTAATLKELTKDGNGFYNFSYDDFASYSAKNSQGKKDITKEFVNDLDEMLLGTLAGVTYSLDKVAMTAEQKESKFNQIMEMLVEPYSGKETDNGIISKIVSPKATIEKLKAATTMENADMIYAAITDAELNYKLQHADARRDSLYNIVKHMESDMMSDAAAEAKGLPYSAKVPKKSRAKTYLVVGLMLAGAVVGSMCLDKNPVDEQSDKVLKEISGGELKDAEGTIATFYKQALDADGKPTLEVVSENVRVVKFEGLTSGTPAVTYTPADGGEQKRVVLGPENTLIVKSKDGKQHMIYGAQEMGGWKVVRSMELLQDHKTVVPASAYNDNIIGNSDHEIYVTLSKENGEMMVNLFMSTDWYLPNINSNRNGGLIVGSFYDMSSNGESAGLSKELNRVVAGGAQLVKGHEDIAFRQFPLSALEEQKPGVDNIIIHPDGGNSNPDQAPTPYSWRYYIKNLGKGMPKIDVQNENGWNTKGAFE